MVLHVGHQGEIHERFDSPPMHCGRHLGFKEAERCREKLGGGIDRDAVVGVEEADLGERDGGARSHFGLGRLEERL